MVQEEVNRGGGGEPEPFHFYALDPSHYQPSGRAAPAEYGIERWYPSWGQISPKGLEKQIGRPTLLLWWLHGRLCGRRDSYWICLIRRQGRIVHYSGVFGRNLRFPFMSAGDLQVGPVWTDPGERGRGLQRIALDAVVEQTRGRTKRLWWLCRAANSVSNHVARKGGFEFVGVGRRQPRWGLSVVAAFRLART